MCTKGLWTIWELISAEFLQRLWRKMIWGFEIEEKVALLQNTAGAALDSAVAMDAQG